MAKIRIDPNAKLEAGSRIELHFKTVGMVWIKAAQLALIERKLKKRRDFSIYKITTPASEPTKVIFTIDIINPDNAEPDIQTTSVSVTCIAIAGVIIAGGLIWKLTLEDSFMIVADTTKTAVETASEIVTSDAGKIALAGAGIALPVVAAVVLYKVLK